MRRRLPDLALDLWPLVLAVVLTLPLLTHGGHPLARDLVFVPHQPWTDASMGLGDAAPRAVPVDALVSMATSVVDGGVVARVVIPLILATAGWGAHRLLGGLGAVARLTAGGFAVWNPYVVERLALGQWALLAGYAALPWLVIAAGRFRVSGDRSDLGATAGWLGLASITPTGGILGSLTVLVSGVDRSRRAWWLGGLCVLLQLPWLIPSLVGPSAATSDPGGIDAFSAGAEGPGGVLVAVLGLGGIWDAQSVPATRDSWWATATALVVIVALATGWHTLRGLLGRSAFRRLVGLGATGFALAFLSSLPGGDHLLRWLVDTVPGVGVLRDSQKFLAPFVLIVVLAVGASASRIVAATRRHGSEVVLAVALLAVPLPLVLLPDGAATTWDTVRPVDYPPGLDRVADLMDAGAQDAAVTTLPMRAYRKFSWGNGLTSSDPAVRWFDRDVVVTDDLQVGDTLVRGENLRARALGEGVAAGPVVEAMRSERVTWALVYLDDPDLKTLDLAGLTRVYADDDLALYRVPGAVAGAEGPSRATRLVVGAVDLIALLVVLAGTALALRRRTRREHDS